MNAVGAGMIALRKLHLLRPIEQGGRGELELSLHRSPPRRPDGLGIQLRVGTALSWSTISPLAGARADCYIYYICIYTTVELSGRELAHGARAAPARGIS